MFLSFNNAQIEQDDDLNDDYLKLEAIKEIEELLSKRSKKINIYKIKFIDAFTLLNKDSEEILPQEIKSNEKNDEEIKQPIENPSNYSSDKSINKLSVISSNSKSYDNENKEDDLQSKINYQRNPGKKKSKNFVLKSELFNSSDSNNSSFQKIRTGENSSKPSVLK